MEHVADALEVGADVVAQGAEAVIDTDGDGTLRTRVPDIARQIPWPSDFTARIRRNAFTSRWHRREDELAESIAAEGPRYRQAFMEGDPENTGVWFGEAAGLIHGIEPAGTIIERMVSEAARSLDRRAGVALGYEPADVYGICSATDGNVVSVRRKQDSCFVMGSRSSAVPGRQRSCSC